MTDYRIDHIILFLMLEEFYEKGWRAGMYGKDFDFYQHNPIPKSPGHRRQLGTEIQEYITKASKEHLLGSI